MQCASLAPKFDELVFEELSLSSERTLVFFASIENGTMPYDFIKREETYNQLIGSFEALELKIKTRPVPSNSALKRIDKLLEAKGMTDTSENYPSAHAMGKIAETLKVMKKSDIKEGLGEITVKTFKNQVLVYLDQALTYENFLNR